MLRSALAPLSLGELKDGTLLASYASLALHVRGKLPTSVATELTDLQRALSHLSSAGPADERAGLATLQATLRRLCRQLAAMPRREPPTGRPACSRRTQRGAGRCSSPAARSGTTAFG